MIQIWISRLTEWISFIIDSIEFQSYFEIADSTIKFLIWMVIKKRVSIFTQDPPGLKKTRDQV